MAAASPYFESTDSASRSSIASLGPITAATGGCGCSVDDDGCEEEDALDVDGYTLDGSATMPRSICSCCILCCSLSARLSGAAVRVLGGSSVPLWPSNE